VETQRSRESPVRTASHALLRLAPTHRYSVRLIISLRLVCTTGANNAVPAAHPVRVHGHDRGCPVSDLPGNFGDETAGYRVGGGKHR